MHITANQHSKWLRIWPAEESRGKRFCSHAMWRVVVFRNGSVDVVDSGESIWTPFVNIGTSRIDAVGWLDMGAVTLEQNHLKGLTTADGVSTEVSAQVVVKVYDGANYIAAVATHGPQLEVLLSGYTLRALQIHMVKERYSSLITRFTEISDRVTKTLSDTARSVDCPLYIEGVTITQIIPSAIGRNSLAARRHEQITEHALKKEQLLFEISESEVRTAMELKRMLEHHKVLQLSGGLLLLDPVAWKEIEIKKLDVEIAKQLGGFARGRRQGKIDGHLQSLENQHNIKLALPQLADGDDPDETESG